MSGSVATAFELAGRKLTKEQIYNCVMGLAADRAGPVLLFKQECPDKAGRLLQ